MKITIRSSSNFPAIEITIGRLIWVAIFATISGFVFSPWAMIPVVLVSLYLEA